MTGYSLTKQRSWPVSPVKDEYNHEEYLNLILRQEVLSKLNNDQHAAEIIFELADKVARMERTIDSERAAVRQEEQHRRNVEAMMFDLHMEIRDLRNKLTRAERGHPTRYRR